LPETGYSSACVLNAFVFGETGAHEFSGVVLSALPGNENS